MADPDIVLTADTSKFDAEMKKAAERMQSNFQQMQSSLRELSQKVIADTQVIQNAFQKMQEGVKDRLRMVTDQFVGLAAGIAAAASVQHVVEIASTFEQLEIRLNAVMGSAAEGERAFAWIKQFAQNTPYSVQQTTDAFMMLKNFGLDPMDGTLQKISDAAAKYGNSAESAKSVSLALGQAWARGKLQGQDTMQMIDAGIPVYDLLSKAIGKSAAEIQKMSEAGTMGRDVMVKLIDQMGKEGAGAAEAKMKSLAGAVSNLGDAFENSIDAMRKSGGFQWMTQSVLALTEVVPPAVSTVGEAFAAIGDVVKAADGVIGDVLHGIGKALDSVFGSSSDSMTGMQLFQNRIKVIEVGLIGFRTGFQVTFETARMILAATAAQVINFSEAASKALKLDWVGAKAAWDKGRQDANIVFSEWYKDIEEISKKGNEAINQAVLGGSSGAKVGDNQRTTPNQSDASPGKSRMSDFEGGLNELKDALEKENIANATHFQFQKQREIQYWQDILTNRKLSHDEMLAVKKKLRDAETALNAEKGQIELEQIRAEVERYRQGSAERVMQSGLAAAQIGKDFGYESAAYIKALNDMLKAGEAHQKEMEKLDQMAVDAPRQHQLSLLDMERERLALSKGLGEISAVEELQALKQLKEQQFQIELAAEQDKAKLLDGDAVAYQQALNKIAQIKQQHDTEMQRMSNQVILAQKQQFDAMTAPFTTAFKKSVNAVIQGTQTAQKATQNMLQSIALEYANMGAKVVANWIRNELFKTQASAAGAAQRGALEAGAASSSIGIGAMASIKKILNAAQETFAGVFANLSPDMGPFAAGPAMASAGAVAAVSGAVASSAGGDWMIPSDRLNFLHKNETILPADKSAGLDRLIQQGSAQPISVNISAVDARGVRDLFNAHGSVLVDALNQQIRNGARLR